MDNGLGITYLTNGVYKEKELKTQYWEPPVDYQPKKSGNTENEDSDNETMDSTGNKKSFARICERFAEKTSMQGVPYINTAKRKLAKIIWAALLLLFIGILTLHLWYSCDQFFQYPKQTTITLGFDNLKYPAITICNVNPVRKSKISLASKELQQMVAAVDPEQLFKQPGSGPGSGSPPGRRRKRFVKNLKNINFNNYSNDANYRDFGTGKQKGKTKSVTFELRQTFEDLLMKEHRSTRISMGYSIDEMLLSCSFSGYECYAENFTLTYHPSYGNCFTLYSDEFEAQLSGPRYGFSISLYMETDEYLGGVTQGYGARVVIHPGNTFPFPDDEGIYISSGWEADIGLKLINITRLDGNYGNCTDGKDFEAKYDIPYTRRTCRLTCEQEALIHECGCVDKTQQEIFFQSNLSHAFCKNRTELVCMNNVLNQFANKEKSCTCFNPCSESQYQTTTSIRQWPTDSYASTLMMGICEQSPVKCSKVKALATSDLQRNFMKLTIYYDDLNFEDIEETPAIEPQQFASDVGGAIGLWIGLSMLSVFEVIQLICELCQFGCYKCSSNKKRNNASEAKYKDSVTSDRTLSSIRNDSKGRFDSYPHHIQYKI